MTMTRAGALRLATPGFTLAAVLAFLAKAMAEALSEGLGGLPPLPISPVLCAVVLGMVWRNVLDVPRWASEGLNFSMTTVLRVGIALVGLRLTMAGASAIAATALPVVLACISVALLVGWTLVRALGVSRKLGILLAVGTAVCGCTAVIALAPVIRARNVETAFAVTCVVLFGCIAMLCYPVVAALAFSGSPLHAGVFLGTAIHDTSQVIGSALIYSQQIGQPDVVAAASVAKLLRNLSIAVLIPFGFWWSRRAGEEVKAGEVAAESQPESGPGNSALPFFVLAFIGCILLRTGGDAWLHGQANWEFLIQWGQKISELCLICGMAAVGLSVSIPQLWTVGWRPLVAGMVLALVVGACSLTLTLVMWHYFP